MDIKLLKRNEMDDKKWNGCVHFAICATPYAYTWYLDNVCENWEGLVYADYKLVMPLVYHKKLGIHYIYQPFFTQQLGIYGSIPISKQTVDTFFNAIPHHYQYIEMQLNESNYPPSHFEHKEKVNYVLDLKPSYETLKEKYSGNLLRNLKKAEKAGLYTDTQMRVEEFADFYKQFVGAKIPDFKESHYHTILRLIYQAQHYQMGNIVGVKNQENKWMAASFFLIHPQRIINLLPWSNEEGLASGAMAFLLDSQLKYNAANMRFFDFEGSMIEGVANFYKSFGAINHPYFFVKMNRLPKLFRIFKK